MRTARQIGGWFGVATAAVLGVSAMGADPLPTDPDIMLTVDATGISRNLIKTVSTIQVKPGPLELRYCIWTPGNHNPSGPIENVVNLVVQDCKGERLHWDRDPTQVDRITLSVPEGCTTIDVAMDYIASQPNPNSRSSDSYGRSNLGVINFNTLLLYPGGVETRSIDVQMLMFIPKGWNAAWALPFKTQDTKMGKAVMMLAKPALPELIDSPMIMGEHLTSVDLARPEGVPEHTFHVVANDPDDARVPGFLVEQCNALIAETVGLFGSYPRGVYRFLLVCAEGIGFGLEHAESTLIGMGRDGLSGAQRDELRAGGAGLLVIPHEYFHVWCGKLKAPKGLITGDFSTPARTELLWVYEGLTAYYDTVLGARAGMLTPAEFREEFLDLAVAKQMRTGRQWRSVEDTARAARFLRQRGVSWFEHRRGQDYYTEASLFWLEADTLIRTGTGGARSLDDFCRSFFDAKSRPTGDPETYTREDVVAALKAIHPDPDWDALVRDRIERPVADLDLSWLLKMTGYELRYEAEPTALRQRRAAKEEGVNLRTSLGLRLTKDGTITEIIPGSPADDAGAKFTSKVIGVDGWVFTPARLIEAVKRSPESKRVELLTVFDDKLETLAIEYDQGPREPRLVRVEGAPDLLEKIGAPRFRKQP